MSAKSKDATPRVVEFLALENMEGVGRVTARKVMEQFGSLHAVRRFPREQILNRLHRVQQSAKLVDRLLDEGFVGEAVEGASRLVEELQKRHVDVLTSDDSEWNEEIDALPTSHRPNVLYAYGNRKLLNEPSVAILGAAPVEERPFEMVQDLVRRVADAGLLVSCSASDGLDTVVIKIVLAVDSLPILTAGMGMARIPPAMRSSVSAAVKAGGLLFSSFQMQHGPFDHDVRERMLVQAAVAKVVVFVEPREGGFSWDALQWSLDRDKPVFALTTTALPDRVHVIREALDMDWILAAMRHVPA